MGAGEIIVRRTITIKFRTGTRFTREITRKRSKRRTKGVS